MPEIKPGDFLVSNGYANVWDNPGDVDVSQIVDYLDEQHLILILQIYTRKFNEHNITEVKILTPGGNIGWVGLEKITGDSWITI